MEIPIEVGYTSDDYFFQEGFKLILDECGSNLPVAELSFRVKKNHSHLVLHQLIRNWVHSLQRCNWVLQFTLSAGTFTHIVTSFIESELHTILGCESTAVCRHIQTTCVHHPSTMTTTTTWKFLFYRLTPTVQFRISRSTGKTETTLCGIIQEGRKLRRWCQTRVSRRDLPGMIRNWTQSGAFRSSFVLVPDWYEQLKGEGWIGIYILMH